MSEMKRRDKCKCKFEASQSGPTASRPMDTRMWMSNVDRIAQQVEERLSLEGTVVVQRAREIQGEARKLARQRAFLRDERRRARMEEELLRLEIADFKAMRNNDWIPPECPLHPSEKRVRLRIGGQEKLYTTRQLYKYEDVASGKPNLRHETQKKSPSVLDARGLSVKDERTLAKVVDFFEASTKVVQRDPGCLLAALCSVGGPLQAELNGTFDIDRDWWTFRLIIKFLREGVLPADTALLAQLYREAGYWRCGSLRRSIEEQMHLYRTGCGASFGNLRPKMVESSREEAADKNEGTAGEGDWWTGSNYNETKCGPENEEPSIPKSEGTQRTAATTWKTDKNSGPRIC